MAHRFAAFLALLVLIPRPAEAQRPQEADDCTYAACALRLQWREIVVGQEGRVLGPASASSIAAMRELVATSDSATYHVGIWADHARKVHDLRRYSGWLLLGGSLLVLAGGWEPAVGWVGIGAGVTGLGLSFWGSQESRRAFDALENTIWWYNRSLAAEGFRP